MYIICDPCRGKGTICGQMFFWDISLQRLIGHLSSNIWKQGSSHGGRWWTWASSTQKLRPPLSGEPKIIKVRLNPCWKANWNLKGKRRSLRDDRDALVYLLANPLLEHMCYRGLIYIIDSRNFPTSRSELFADVWANQQSRWVNWPECDLLCSHTRGVGLTKDQL